MPVYPYDKLVLDCVDSLKQQTAEVEIIIVEQPIEKHINKNALLNYGYEKSNGDWIFHCDADFAFEDRGLLERMSWREVDAIYPLFYSNVHKCLKVADGAAFVRREVLERHGPLDESGQGVSLVTFPFLEWCMNNCCLEWNNDFVIQPQQGYASTKRVHHKTRSKNKGCYKRVTEELKRLGVWP